MIPDKIWVTGRVSDQEAEKTANDTGISRLAAKVFLSRGMSDPGLIRKFMNPSLDDLHDPFLLKDMEAASDRLVKALKSNEKITLYGDYDVDGVTGISILYDFLTGLGADVDYYIPDRVDEGYGLSVGALDRILETGGTTLIITVDCGITAVDEIIYLNEKGVDVIITDHHECKEILPPACAVVNPHRHDCAYPFKELAGVGVAFKLINAVCLIMELDNAHLKYLDLVTIGTVADVVPLVDENRCIVRCGIESIANTKNTGLKALIAASGLKDRQVNTFGIGFILAPRINAAGRIGSAERGVRLFTTPDEKEALDIAYELNDENTFRQDTEAHIMQQVTKLIESEINLEKDKVIVAWGDGWHHGVIGIAASKIAERYYRPCILISVENGMAKGSGRSIDKFNIFKALCWCGNLLEKYGGHEMAAGLSLQTENLREFRNKINEYADSVLSAEDLVPKIKIDVNTVRDDISPDSVRELEALAPFGAGNPQPVFSYNRLNVDEVRTVGDNKHLKLKLSDECFKVNAIGFGMGRYAEVFESGDLLDAAFSLEINQWNSCREVQFVLKDIKFCDEIVRKCVLLYNLDKNIELGKLNGYNYNDGFLRIEDIIPERSDLVAVYQYIRARAADRLDIDDLFVFAKKIAGSYKINMNYLKAKKSIEIFEELGLMKTEGVGKYGMIITLCENTKGKAKLENSKLYRKLQELKKSIKGAAFQA